MKRLSIAVLVLGFAACANDVDLVSDPEAKVVIANFTGRVIHYWLVERESLARSDYTLRRCPDDPDRLKPLGWATLTLDEVHSYDPGDELVLFWWTPGPPLENGCFDPAHLSTMVLKPAKMRGNRIYLSGFEE